MADRAVILDRDGVIVIPEFRDGRSFAPTRLEDFVLYPEAPAQLARLKQAGFRLFVATNQPDVGNGKVARGVVEAMHEIVLATLPVEAIKACYHGQKEGCACRKPAPGMLLELVAEHAIDPALSFMVGDRASDVAAGRAAGCRTVFIDLGYVEAKPADADFYVTSLTGAVDAILGA